jgi:hypothetical protein
MAFLFVALTVALAVAQISFINQGLALFDGTLFVPLYTALLIVCGVIFGSVYYMELECLGRLSWVMFPLGTVVTVSASLRLSALGAARLAAASGGKIEMTPMPGGGGGRGAGGVAPGGRRAEAEAATAGDFKGEVNPVSAGGRADRTGAGGGAGGVSGASPTGSPETQYTEQTDGIDADSGSGTATPSSRVSRRPPELTLPQSLCRDAC